MSDDPKQIELNIEISAANTTSEDAIQMAQQLLSELREMDVESAELTKSESTQRGAKGDPTTLNSIVLAVFPTFLPSVIGLVQAWMSRGQGRVVKFKGMGIKFEGSPEDLQKLLKSLERGHSGLPGDSTTDAPPPKKL